MTGIVPLTHKTYRFIEAGKQTLWDIRHGNLKG